MNVSRVNHQRLRVIAIGMALLLALWAVFSPFGVVRYLQVRKRLATEAADLARLENENRALAKEIGRLEHDPAFIEDVGRKRYGLIKKNELIFDFSREAAEKKKH
ncbi:MAG: septum formation initiator family protein [Desulfobacteraceae bacterium]|nr:septum formation initiator family protein [Desulfobacteraceae bacterium]